MDSQLNSIKTFKKIIKLLPAAKKRQCWLILTGLAAFAGIETITTGVIAIYVSSISDPEMMLKSSAIEIARQYIPFHILSTPFSLISSLSFFLAALVIFKNAWKAGITYASDKFSEFVSALFGERVLNGFLNTSYEWHINHNSAELVMIVLWRKHFGSFIKSFLHLLCDVFLVLVMILAVFLIEPIISTFATFVFSLSSLIIYKKIRKPLDNVANRFSNYNLSIHRDVTKCLNGIKDVKIFGREYFFLQEYLSEIKIFCRLKVLMQLLSNVPAMLLESIGFLMLIASVYFMLYDLGSSTIKVTGTIALLAVTAWRVLPAINRILAGASKIRTSLPYIKKFFFYLSEIKSNQDEHYRLPKLSNSDFSFQDNLEFKNVSFRYIGSSKLSLENISFTIKKGQAVGIVGVSGAGKSTLADLIIGLLPVNSGRYLIDSQDLTLSLRKAWINKVGYVSQSPYIFDGSVAENVAFGLKVCEIDSQRVLKSCRLAAMQDFLQDLPEGIDTVIGERGVRLSGGQQQRLAIARALYKDPDVMIFDEATSSLDTKNERIIQKTINSLKGKQTIIIIAHRLSTIEMCDFLIWIEKGKIKKIGYQEEILQLYNESQATIQ